MIFNEIKNQNVAIIEDTGEKRTYGQLIDKALFYQGFIPKGALVLLRCDYYLETLEFYFACLYNEYVPIMVDASYDESYANELIKLYHPQYVWNNGVLNDNEIIICENKHMLVKTGYEQYAHAPELGMLMPTSGSTSNPKMACLSKKNMYMRSIGALYGFNENDRGIVTVPLGHALGSDLINYLWHNNAVVLLTRASVISQKFWSFYEKCHPTVFAGVPYTYELLYRTGFLERNNEALRMIMQTGAVWNPQQRQVYAEKLPDHVNIVLYYASTEASRVGAVASDTPIDTREYGYRIDDCVKVDLGDDGELRVKSDLVFMGYAYGAEDLRDLAGEEEYYATGDIGYFDEHNLFHITGRKSRFVKLLGERISLGDVETCVMNLSPAIECACINKDDQTINVFVVGVDDIALVKKRICETIKKIDESMLNVIVYERLPRLYNGKIDYKRMEQLKRNS